MVYSFQLWKHPNIHYREVLIRLSRLELFCMLRRLGVDSEITTDSIGSSVFLTVAGRELSPRELSYLAGHSSVTMISERVHDLFKPMPVQADDAFPEDLPEILKYKGKTNPSFTRMMLNTGLALTSFTPQPEPPLVLDPLCGRGTTLFCALCAGAEAIGIDADRRDLKEASDYFSRYLKNAGIKHTLRSFSTTVRGTGIPGKSFSFAADREAWKQGKTVSLTLHNADTSLSEFLLRKKPAHLLVTDLPYGVQHAPQHGAVPESFPAFLSRVLPAWKRALYPGAVLAVSFNTLTLKAEALRKSLSDAGFLICDDPLFSGLSHAVEQAVVRDLVFAKVR